MWGVNGQWLNTHLLHSTTFFFLSSVQPLLISSPLEVSPSLLWEIYEYMRPRLPKLDYKVQK